MARFKIGDRVRWTDKSLADPELAGRYGKGPFSVAPSREGWVYICIPGHGDVGFLEERFELDAPAAPLITMDGKYQTRDGRKVLRVLCVDAPGSSPVVALIEGFRAGSCYPGSRRADGLVYGGDRALRGEDLVPAVDEEKECWASVYLREQNRYPLVGSECDTRESAEKMLYSGRRIAILHLRYAEGKLTAEILPKEPS